MRFLTTDTLVIGSGIAGLLSTILLAEQNISVLIVSETETLGGGASYFPLKATLGIQVTDTKDVDKELFTEDFIRTSQGLIDAKKMDVYINESNKNVDLLQKIGLHPYLRNDKRPACFAKYSRPIYLISDWQKSKDYVHDTFSKNDNISIQSNTKVVKLFQKNNVVVGALLFSHSGYIVVNAKTIILATGGMAGLYKDNLYTNDVDGSGWSLASDIGARLINTEFIQFIPSFLKPKYKTLFGEHTIKYLEGVYDDTGADIFSDFTSEEKTTMFYERSSYAPFSIDFASSIFDIRIFEAIQKGSKGVKFCYKKELYSDNEAFYTIYLDWLTKTQDINLVQDTIIISHFAHASNGGIEINENGETSIKNLFALGEVSCGVEGANRMGGNSVGGIIVFAPRAVNAIANRIANVHNEDNEILEKDVSSFIFNVQGSSLITAQSVLNSIAVLLQNNASIVRTKKGLCEALRKIAELEKDFCIPISNESLLDYKAYHALRTSKVLLTSMLKQLKSLGAHFIT